MAYSSRSARFGSGFGLRTLCQQGLCDRVVRAEVVDCRVLNLLSRFPRPAGDLVAFVTGFEEPEVQVQQRGPTPGCKQQRVTSIERGDVSGFEYPLRSRLSG